MNKIEWIDSVVGKPWVDRADGPDYFDCWGVVLDSFLRVDEKPLHNVEGYDSGELIETAGAREAQGWPEIESPIDGCVFCVILASGDMIHVGRIFQVGSGLVAVHAAGKHGNGQTVAEPIRAIKERFKHRLHYYTRPQ